MPPVRRILMSAMVAAAVAVPLALASGAAPAAAAPTTWTQRALCPSGGRAVVLSATEDVRHTGSGSWTVVGAVTATTGGAPPVTYHLAYRGQSAPAGATVLTGRSLDIAAGGAPVVVSGTATLAPDGFLGHAAGSVQSVCAALAG